MLIGESGKERGVQGKNPIRTKKVARMRKIEYLEPDMQVRVRNLCMWRKENFERTTTGGRLRDGGDTNKSGSQHLQIVEQ
jgi:hypothetical protein